MYDWIRRAGVIGGLAAGTLAVAQVPDLLSSYQASARALAMGGSTSVTDTNTLSPINNPATLAYVSRTEFGLALRNIPRANSLITGGSVANPSLDTSLDRGRTALAHLGVVVPVGSGGFGVSYTIDGQVDHQILGDGIPVGANLIRGYRENTEVTTNLLTLSLGRPSGAYNFGYGLVVAQSKISASTSFTETTTAGAVVQSVSTSASGTRTGIGAVIGIQTIPHEGQNYTWGLTLRTPIALSGGSDVSTFLSRLPAKIEAGYTQRRDLKGETEDYFMLAARASYQFGGSSSDRLERGAAFGGGIGAEYNVLRDGTRIPIRIGFSHQQGSGSNFTDRSGFSFGLGYRPASQQYGVDVSVVRSNKGGQDLAIALSYRPGRND